MLSRRVGAQYIEVIEDAVQSALMTALESWTIAGLPDNPSAWLFRVAHNNLMGELRQRTRRHRIANFTCRRVACCFEAVSQPGEPPHHTLSAAATLA